MAINLNDLGNQLGSSSEAVKSSGQTGSSLVTTTAKDSLLAVDGYGKTSVEVLSTMKNTILNRITETRNYLMNTQIADLGSLNDALSSAAELKKQATDYTSALSGAIGQSISTVKGVSDGLVNAANQTMNEINNGIDSTYSTINGQVTQLSGGTSAFQANNFLSSINTILNDTSNRFESLVDRLSVTSLKASILQQASYLGLSNVITSVYASDANNPTLTEALGQTLEQSLSSGNITLIRTLAETLGGVYILQKVPTAITLVLQNYTFASAYSVNEYDTLAKELIAVLVLIDPNWNKSGYAKFGSQLSIYRSISSKAKNVLLTQPGYAYAIYASTHFSESNPLTLARANYPYVAFAD